MSKKDFFLGSSWEIDSQSHYGESAFPHTKPCFVLLDAENIVQFIKEKVIHDSIHFSISRDLDSQLLQISLEVSLQILKTPSRQQQIP
jgi:hypothetical protein